MAGTKTSGFASLSPSQRQLAASIGGLTNWSRINSPEERRAAMGAANEGRKRSLAEQVDPDGKLPPAELEAAVTRLRKAQMRQLAMKSAAARAARAGVTTPDPPKTPPPPPPPSKPKAGKPALPQPNKPLPYPSPRPQLPPPPKPGPDFGLLAA